jgi:UDP-N-acetylmuramyl pentapeptide phosphotransferase/UDP-N-acetylglucosamine-1-phosphate transferase
LTNGINIYAGFNGLETGLGLITSFSLGICSLIYGSLESAISLLVLAGALTAFLKWNLPPAKVLPGNSGSYLIGAVLSASIIAGSIKLAGTIACVPYLFNL